VRENRTIIIEREFPHPPEKVWRALTQPHLVAEWLMQNDIASVAGHSFSLSAEWGTVECRIRQADPPRSLSYDWKTKDLDSVVSWTLSPSRTGTLVRMEQAGFRPDQKSYFRGATARWPQFLDALDDLLARLA
jgi:uncharacterized protein YndB with AHSA1/START domain